MDQNPAFQQQTHVNRLNQASARIQRIKILIRRKWWILVLTMLLGVFVQAFRVNNEQVVYECFARLIAGRLSLPGTPQFAEDQRYYFGTQEQIIKSAAVAQNAETMVEEDQPNLEKCRVTLDVFRDPESSVFMIRAKGSNGEYVQAYLDAVLDAYDIARAAMRLEGSSDTITALNSRIGASEAAIVKLKDEIAEFENRHSDVVLQERENQAAADAASLRAMLVNLETELKLLETLDIDEKSAHQVNEVQSALSVEVPGTDGTGSQLPLVTGGPEAEYLQARRSLELLEAEKRRLLRDLLPEHPDVIAMDDQISRQQELISLLRDEVEKNFEKRQEIFRKQIAGLQQQIQTKEDEALAMRKLLLDYRQMTEALTKEQQLLASITKSRGDLQLNQELPLDVLQRMGNVSTPIESDKEAVRKIATGGILGLLLGFGILLLLDRIDDRINSVAEYDINFTEDIVGQIPEQPHKGDMALLTKDDSRHIYAEAFRNLRSSIIFKDWHAEKPRTIMIASAVPGEGKTTIAGNLALTLALSGARVLLIDGDLRRGELHEAFGAENEAGLSEVLSGKAEWNQALQRTHMDNLFLLSRGDNADHSSERYLSPNGVAFLNEIKEAFDYVIIDSAPVLVADDTTTFAPFIDTVLFVIRMSSTNARLSARALDLLYDRRVSVGGVILNRSTLVYNEYAYYGYGDYYTEAKGGTKKA